MSQLPPPSTMHALLESALDRQNAEPLQRQLYARIRDAILKGQLAAGSKLPGSRALAETLAVSRNTVAIAYEHLMAEGYVIASKQGTLVAAVRRTPPRQAAAPSPAAAPVARRHTQLRPSEAQSNPGTVLRPGVPALSQFPLALWRRTVEQVLRDATPAALNYGDPLGQMELRTAIARHLALTRGVHCAPEQVIITEGAHEALMLCVRLFTNPGDIAWVEDPGYRGAKAAMRGGDLRIVPKRLDAQGLRTDAHDWRHPPRLIYTTPSHQYPMGVVMTVARRLALIADARKHGAWIIEDDYDSEFRHSGEPIGAMQGLVDDAPILYVGTFAKTMFPSLRLGFLVIPKMLVAPLNAPLREILRGGHTHEQLAMARFIDAGHFGRHIRRMKKLYLSRQLALRRVLATHLRIPHTIEGGQCGLHLTVKIPAQYPDQQLTDAAREHHMAPVPLSAFALQPTADDNGFVLGYGNTGEDLFEQMVGRLGRLAGKFRR